ncbi:hypothetical protein DFH07DRAFT_771000 [Mycena maculata]|uniref:Uncharacterized protein n=1 Tax=Mycena maculata TaxID=230809 RepID=A0AAD7NJA4_9AGAR|nr:hypothetical protein DFH07DRAFT_771000 [Mycena maculata]
MSTNKPNPPSKRKSNVAVPQAASGKAPSNPMGGPVTCGKEMILIAQGEALFPPPSSLVTASMPSTPRPPIIIKLLPPGAKTPASSVRSGGLPDLQTVSDSSVSESPSGAQQNVEERSMYISTLLRATKECSELGTEEAAPFVSSMLSMMRGVCDSEPPSFASLVNPLPSKDASAALSQIENDSITAALMDRRGRHEIGACLHHHHPAYDPKTDDNPLLPYGAEDSVLPGKTPEESIALHDVVMRWSLPHRTWHWNDLKEGVTLFYEPRVSHADLIVYLTDTGVKVYSLRKFHLGRIAQLTPAVHQVLYGIYEFCETLKSRPFEIDPHCLQFRLYQSMKHAKKNLNTIKMVYGQNRLDIVSSVDSTLSSVRSNFRKAMPSVELGKIIVRPDYGGQIEPEIRAHFVTRYNSEHHKRYYRYDTMAKVMAQKLPPSPDPSPVDGEDVPPQETPPWLGTIPR